MTHLEPGVVGDSSAPPAGDSMKAMATAAIDSVKHEAADLASKVRDKTSDQIQHHKESATEAMSDFAAAIRKAGDDLAQHDQSFAARLVKQTADGLESFSRSVGDKRPEELLGAVRDFGRENPIAFSAGAVLVGLAIGRFIRSSEDHATSNASAPTPPSGATTVAPQISATASGNGSAAGRSGDGHSDVRSLSPTLSRAQSEL